jgi:hypothetical protein
MYSATAIVTTDLTVPGLAFEEFEYAPAFPMVTSIVLRSDGKQVSAALYLRDVPITAQLVEVAKEAYDNALRRLECQFEFLSGKSQWSMSKVTDQDNPQPSTHILCGVGSAQANSCGRAAIIRSIGTETLRPIVEAPRSSHDVYFEMFYHASTADNPVVEFLGHYQILTMLAGNGKDATQRVVDDFLVSLGVPRNSFTSKPIGKDEYESAFTRLRNQIMHVRLIDGAIAANQRDVKAEIEIYLPELCRLTRAGIQRFLP